MATTTGFNPKTDAYIRNAAPFAQPILTHVRTLVHKACPEAVETIKWGVPHFDYKGVICGMAGFKAHVRVVFWKSALLQQAGLTTAAGADQFGKVTSLDDLPDDKTFIALINTAARMNEDNVKAARARAATKPPIRVPPRFLAALKKRRKALAAFEAFPPSHKREYVEWISAAKAEETRTRRIAQAIEWIATGKSRNWKYQR